jgi:hypothetical protein
MSPCRKMFKKSLVGNLFTGMFSDLLQSQCCYQYLLVQVFNSHLWFSLHWYLPVLVSFLLLIEERS